MQDFSELKPKKIIQKRAAKKERYARMARIKHRMLKNVLTARVQDLEVTPKYTPHNAVYEHVLGMMLVDKGDEIDGDLSMLNDNYVSNSVTVQNGTNKLLCVKLKRNGRRDNLLRDEVLDEWEKRNDPYWNEWARSFRHVSHSYKRFIDKYKPKFESNRLDEEALQRRRVFAIEREDIMSKKAALEMKVKFNDQGILSMELIFNSGFVNKMKYEFEEFIQKILVEGIPKITPSCTKGTKNHPALYEELEVFFRKSHEMTFPNMYFLDKHSNLKTVDFSFMVGGVFVQKAAELSFIFSIDGSDMSLEEGPINRPVYRLYLEQKMAHDTERRYFLQTFYKEHWDNLMYKKDKETAQIRPIVNYIEDDIDEKEEETDYDSIGCSRVSEELVLKDTVDIYSRKSSNDGIVSAPFTDYLSKFMPQLQMMKNIYQTKQMMLDHMLDNNIQFYLSNKQ